MTALSARAWPLGAAWRNGVLLAFVLVVLTANVEAQNVQTTAVPPSFAIQPLYGELLHQQLLHSITISCCPITQSHKQQAETRSLHPLNYHRNNLTA
jgi:hypothetical protein